MSIVEKSQAELTRTLASYPIDEASVHAVCAAWLDSGRVEELLGTLDACAQAHGLADHAMAELCFRIAQESSDAHAVELCRAALDRDPLHVAALSLFEQLADASWSDELCARYQIFLEDAPLHGVAPHVCELVASKLATAERRAAADGLAFDDMHHLARVFESLCTVPDGVLTRGMSELDRVAAWPSHTALSVSVHA